MKHALEESVRYASSPPAMASAAHPLHTGAPERNLTSFQLRTRQSSEYFRPTIDRPPTPHVTLHQFRQFQHSAQPPSSPDLYDYKRVRRKQSFADLVRAPFAPGPLPPKGTTYSPSLQTNFSQPFFPSILPPLPLTPVPRASNYSPSLSSTVDTLQSSPTHTPVQQDSSTFEQWRDFERVELIEPIRTKRKFESFRPAKRLPHSTALHEEGDGIWEVHAAVIDIGIDDFDGHRVEVGSHVVSSTDSSGGEVNLREGTEQRLSNRKARVVRFEGVETEDSSSGTERSGPSQENEPGSTSSFSPSKFSFPAPPGQNWTGTFGHLKASTPPTSPATLHYKGASFDVVNPHTSFLLGSTDFETPAEIDGLLDDYFNFRDSATMPYKDVTGEKSSSQQSLQTASSEARRRILFDDPESARRKIMGLPGSSSDQTFFHNPYQESPLAQRSNEHQATLSDSGQQRPRAPTFSAKSESEVPRVLQLHPSLREALNRGTPNVQEAHMAQYELAPLPGTSRFMRLEAQKAAEAGMPSGINAVESANVVDRGSSLYPHSQRSNPFDLTLSDFGDDQKYQNIDELVAVRPSSYFAGNGAMYDKELEDNFAIYEDAPNANATQATQEQDSTVGNIFDYYNYSREPLAPLGASPASSDDLLCPSPSVELGRVGYSSVDPFESPEDGSEYNTDTRTFEDPRRTARMESPPLFVYDGRRQLSNIAHAPNLPVPPTPVTAREARGTHRYQPEYTDLPTTDQTYGNTGQLLQLTPQQQSWPFPGPQDIGVAEPTAAYDEEDKENTPPHQAFPEDEQVFNAPPTWSEVRSRVRGPPTVNNLAAQPIMPRSSSYYPDDDSVWESTQSSDSHPDLTESVTGAVAQQCTRPSQDSYADTSVCGSNHRLSYPRPPLPSPFDDPQAVARPRAPSPYSVRPDWRAVVHSDEKLARKILEDKILEDTLLGETGPVTPRRDKAEYMADMKVLERLRKNNPTAVEKAVNAVADKLGKLSTLKPVYSPQTSFSKAEQFGLGKQGHGSTQSERQGLLEGRCDSPCMSGGLQFSDTANTFKTARRVPSLAMGLPVKAYSPLSPPPVTPPATALVRDGTATSSSRVFSMRSLPQQETPVTENIEMKRLRKKPVSRVAMSSQTELRPLQLAESTAASGVTGRLTDVQLAEAEPGWTMTPDFSNNGPLARLTSRNSGPTAFLIQKADGSVERVSTLMKPQRARNLRTLQLQRQLTRPYFRVCVVFPVTAALFGLGCLDYKMIQMTDGTIVEMSPTAKKQALMMYVPLGIIFYTCIGLMIALISLVAVR